MFRLLIILSALTFLSLPGSTQSGGDTGNPEYEGYRIHVDQPTIIAKRKKFFKVKLRVTNTGKLDLTPADIATIKEKLVVNPDISITDSDIGYHTDLIAEKLRSRKISLKSGQSQYHEFKVKIPKDKRVEGEMFSVSGNLGNNDNYRPNRDLCPDLVIDSLEVLKKDKKFVYVEFLVKNEGKGAINVIGDKKDIEDNVVTRAYFSGTPRFSQGAIAADQIYLQGLEETRGILFPGDSMKLQFKVSRRKQTKYTKMLLLFLDADRLVIECKESNNHAAVLVK